MANIQKKQQINKKHTKNIEKNVQTLPNIESTSKCKFVAKLGKMFEKDLIWGKEI